jgi:hypothetical protein
VCGTLMYKPACVVGLCCSFADEACDHNAAAVLLWLQTMSIWTLILLGLPSPQQAAWLLLNPVTISQ